MARAGSSALAGPAGTRCPAVRPIVTSRAATFATVRTWPASRVRPTLPARRAAGAETAAPAATRARASTHAGGTAADAREVIVAARAAGGHRDAAPGQPGAEQVAGIGQATAEGRLAPGQLDGGLRVGLSFQVAEHDRQAEPLGQSRELLVHRDEPVVDVGGLAGGDEVGQVARRSRSRRSVRDRSRPACTATRCATRCSQPPTASRPRIVPALRIRSRNVAWKASSTSGRRAGWSGRRPGPSARAASPAPRTPTRRDARGTRSRSWPSVRPATVPASNNP